MSRVHASSSRSVSQITMDFRPLFSSSQGANWSCIYCNYDEYVLNINKTNQDNLLQVLLLPSRYEYYKAKDLH